MRGKTWLKVALAVLVALIGLAWYTLGGGAGVKEKPTPQAPQAQDESYTGGVTKPPRGPIVTSTVGPNSTLGAARAGSGGCAKMDAVLSHLLADTPEGRAFTSAVSNDRTPGKTDADVQGSTPQWARFLGVVAAHEGEFVAAAGDDPDAKSVLADLKAVTQVQPQLLDGRIPKFADKDDAQQQAGAGLVPTPDKAYEDASEKVSQALDRVSWCMPSWPVIF